MSENSHRGEERSADASSAFDRQFYRALAPTQRRRLLYVLLDGEERTVDELATVLLGWDVSESGGVGEPDDHERTRIRLHHVHLPLLEEAGLVDYDHEARTVRLASLDPTAVEYIRRGVDTEQE